MATPIVEDKNYFRDHFLPKISLQVNREILTTGTVGKGVLRPSKEDSIQGNDDQTKYRSGVGLLLWLTKTRLDICNVVRKLTKVNGRDTKESMD